MMPANQARDSIFRAIHESVERINEISHIKLEMDEIMGKLLASSRTGLVLFGQS
jgi:hypothetical protein